jgi:hypothetical protein
MSNWRPNYQFNTSTYTIEPGITSIEISGSTGGAGTLTLPNVTAGEVGTGYTITISDANSYISGLTIEPNPSDTSFKINGESSVVTYTKGIPIKLSYEGFGNWILVTGDATDSIKTFGIVIDGGDSAITTGIKGDLVIPYNLRILSWQILADQSGGIKIDIWKDNYANFPPTLADSIIGGGVYPTISGTVSNTSSSLTGWTTQILKDEILRFNVDTVSSIKRATLTLKAKII